MQLNDRIVIKNIYHMLAYAYQNLNEKDEEKLSAEAFENIHNLFAAILCQGIAALVKRGLNHDYICETEETGSLKGKLNLAASVKRQSMIKKRLVCQYDIFSENILLNQVLKTTMLLLLRYGDINHFNRTLLRKRLVFFNRIDEISPSLISWDSISYHRNNVTYRMLINVCQLIIKGLLQTSDNGHYNLAKFLDDQQMSHLYEKFVLAYYRREHPELSATASYIDWAVENKEDLCFLPSMKSDIMLSYEDKRLIIDTKYYSHTMQKNPMSNRETYISGNLYQIFAYVKNKDKQQTGKVNGVLLYAQTIDEETPEKSFLIGGNLFGIHVLNLNTEWNIICRQLDFLLEKYLNLFDRKTYNYIT